MAVISFSPVSTAVGVEPPPSSAEEPYPSSVQPETDSSLPVRKLKALPEGREEGSLFCFGYRVREVKAPKEDSLPARKIYRVVKAPKEDSPPARKIYRVPDYINPEHEHFNAMELRLGLHTHASLQTAQGGMDRFKVAVARMVVCRSDKPETAYAASDPLKTARWADFVKDLELEGAQAMYEATPQHDPPHAPRSLLALDALFLCAYLRSALESYCWGYQFKGIFQDRSFAARRFPLYRDMMIMGNQVPMSLLLAVIKQLQKEEVSRKREKLAGNDVTAVDTAHVDKKGESFLDISFLPDADKETLKKGEIEPVVEDGDKDAPSMLNKLLVNLVAAVYPFTHGHKVKSWKQDLKAHLEKHHDPKNPDALWKCDHILASAYLAICGVSIYLAPPPEDEKVHRGHKFLLLFKQKQESDPDLEDQRSDKISSATSLKKFGIKFKAIDRPLRLDLVQFDKHSTLLLPKLVMNDHTAALFRNLALYEQVEQNKKRSDFRTYLYLMDSLVDDPEDVRLLVKAGVIVNQLGNDEDVCKLWNSMCEGLFISSSPPQYMKTLQKRIGDHLRAPHNRWFADMREKYWEDPLRFVAWVAVCVVTISTALQTIMAFYSYFHPPSNG